MITKEFIVDDYVMVGKQKIKLNLNVYRNLHFQVNNKAKKIFTQQLLNYYPELTNFKANKVKISYIVNPNNLKKFDLMNVVSIVDKFFLDALVALECLPDDNCDIAEYESIKKGLINRNNKCKKIIIICNFF